MIIMIHFGIERILDKDIFKRATIYFRVILILNEHEGSTTNFTKMREVRV